MRKINWANWTQDQVDRRERELEYHIANATKDADHAKATLASEKADMRKFQKAKAKWLAHREGAQS